MKSRYVIRYILALSAMYGLVGRCGAQARNGGPHYSAMAPISDYRMPSREAEITLARSAAPSSIARDAEILVFAEKGYESVFQGKNGFVCLVERSWAKDTNDPEFWNPKMRAPVCLNETAAQSHLRIYLKKTEWALAGFSGEQIGMKIKSGFERGEFITPSAVAMSFMMGKDGYLSDSDRHWHPHLMFAVSGTNPSSWGANVDGSPVLGAKDPEERVTIFFVPLDHWSDDTPDSVKR